MADAATDRTYLMVYELRSLLVRMRYANDPFADELERAVKRFLVDGEESDRIGHPAEEIRVADGDPLD